MAWHKPGVLYDRIESHAVDLRRELQLQGRREATTSVEALAPLLHARLLTDPVGRVVASLAVCRDSEVNKRYARDFAKAQFHGEVADSRAVAKTVSEWLMCGFSSAGQPSAVCVAAHLHAAGAAQSTPQRLSALCQALQRLPFVGEVPQVTAPHLIM